MTPKNNLTEQIKFYTASVLNAYSVLFYSYNKIFGALLLCASFFFPASGLCGLLGLITAIVLVRILKYNRHFISDATFTFNSMMVGVGMGIMYEINLVLIVCVIVAAAIAVLFTVVVWNINSKYNLPVLSLPFLFTFWMVLPALKYFHALQYNQMDIYYLNFLMKVGGENLVDWYKQANNDWFPLFVTSYLKTLSVIFFQQNIFTGIIVGVGIFIHSRIAFSLSFIGYTTAYCFYKFAGIDMHQLTQFHAGFNYIIVPMALGCYYTIPSVSSYLSGVAGTVASILIGIGVNHSFVFIGASAYSLPFVVTILSTILALRWREENRFPQLVTVQYFSPEKNLYKQQNNNNRLKNLIYFPVHLPFFGEWTVTQAHDGKHTHKGEWAKAFDFVLTDEEAKQYHGDGNFVGDYYCFNKPVTAAADGWVSEVINHVDDNEIGAVNMLENWGNSIVIYHTNDLYSQISHLKKWSAKVKVGDYVKKGDIIALCGNSGRSPIPHLHFQLQTVAKVGAKTLDHPLSYFIEKNKSTPVLKSFDKPKEEQKISNIETTELLKSAFTLYPGKRLKYEMDNGSSKIISEWECFTDSYNRTYLYCHTTQSTAYFINDGSLFYFTDFEGDKKSLLFYFYLSCYKVMLGNYLNLKLEDQLPLNLFISRFFVLNDFVAPFFNFAKTQYSSAFTSSDDEHHPTKIKLQSIVTVKWVKQVYKTFNFEIEFSNNQISIFKINQGKNNFTARCVEN